MRYSTTVGVDLAKNVIQISVISSRGKELSNRSLTRKKFADFLDKQKPSLVAFESCATAHYWGRAVERHPVCKRLTAIEGIGPIGALSLYAVMGCGKAFTRSREFSAYLGLTPRQ